MAAVCSDLNHGFQQWSCPISCLFDYFNSLVITTSLNAGKVKRIRNNGKATIYVTNQNGSKKLSDSLDLQASLIEEASLKKQAADEIRKKYGLMAKMIMKGSDENRAIIKLEDKGGVKWSVQNAVAKTKIKLNYFYATLWCDQTSVFYEQEFPTLRAHGSLQET